MFSVKSIVLTAALCGRSAVRVSAAGCHPAYSTGTNYAAGDKVSATTTASETSTESCSPAGVGDCPANGFKTTTTETTETHNYECVSGANSAFCGQSGFAPGGQFSSTAWIKETNACDGSATPVSAPGPASAPVPAPWSGGGCPKAYVAGTDYAADDVVSVVMATYTAVYQCAEAPTNLFCGMGGYEPGTGLYTDSAWTALGSCTGTVAPTGSPSYDALADAGGCPGAFDDGETYEEGDKVSVDGLVYQCNSFPSSLHCSQAGYEPGTSVGEGAQKVEFWKQAWTITGFCSGTIAPTTSPNYVSLQDMGGCPDEWTSQTYEEGDRVSDGSLVYVCKAWPFSGHCGQAGYEPNVDPATPGAWKDAWTVAGFCSGSIGPTSSPTFDAANSVGACPDEWMQGSNVAYEEGDMVSVTVSEAPLRKVAYRCKAWPFSGFCGQLSPTVFGGDQGWTLAGSCDGSVGPTASPSFDSLADTNEGCPQAWSAATIDYEAGDQVSFAVSSSPERKVVYECRDWPNSGYCNQGAGFQPGSQFGNMAWTLKGYCDGTVAPTAAPVAYAGNCTYTRDVTVEQACTQAEAGTNGCVCQGNSCTKDVITPTTFDVDAWSSSVDYVTDDVVRVGTKRFKCREWPNFFWCRLEAYRPTADGNSISDQAWTEDGECSSSSSSSTTTSSFSSSTSSSSSSSSSSMSLGFGGRA